MRLMREYVYCKHLMLLYVRGHAGIGFNEDTGHLAKMAIDSIAFGSAPRREVDSQPFSPCARPAVN